MLRSLVGSEMCIRDSPLPVILKLASILTFPDLATLPFVWLSGAWVIFSTVGSKFRLPASPFRGCLVIPPRIPYVPTPSLSLMSRLPAPPQLRALLLKNSTLRKFPPRTLFHLEHLCLDMVLIPLWYQNSQTCCRASVRCAPLYLTPLVVALNHRPCPVTLI